MDVIKLASAHFFEGLDALNRGRFKAAEESFLKSLELVPDRPSTLCNLSIAYAKMERYEEALVICNKAIALKPDFAEAYTNRGDVLYWMGLLDDAIESCNKAISLRPDSATAYSIRGNSMKKLRRLDEALANYDIAIELKPDFYEVYFNRGNVLKEFKRLDEALGSYDKSIGLKPNFSAAYLNRGMALTELKRLDEALVSYDKAIALNPNFAEAYFNRGNALTELKRPDEALVSYDKAIELNPNFAEAYFNRGNALKEFRRLGEALESYDKAIALKPSYAQAYGNRGMALTELKRLDEALVSYDKAIVLKPDHYVTLWNQANLLLLLGNFTRGLKQYEYRGSRQEFSKHRRHELPLLLDAALIKGKTLLIYNELYFGDMIQFCRYAILAEHKGAKVIISAQNNLHDLLATLSPSIEIIPEKTEPNRFDYHVPLMSLPLAFHTELETIPANVPYLHSDKARVARWNQIIGDHGFKIGICWQGSNLSEESGRSFPLMEFGKLSQMPNVRLISLQKYDGIDQLERLPSNMKIERLGDEFDSGPQAFLDTAAVMENLDLVITCDTAIAHLAGALARPTWVALKYVPDWRWFLDRNDSPWYPTMRLFRQDKPEHWQSAFEKMELAIMDLLKSFQIGEIK